MTVNLSTGTGDWRAHLRKANEASALVPLVPELRWPWCGGAPHSGGARDVLRPKPGSARRALLERKAAGRGGRSGEAPPLDLRRSGLNSEEKDARRRLF